MLPARLDRAAVPAPDGVFGIDFWHAVEFSRIGRAPIEAFRPFSGQPFKPTQAGQGCQTRLPLARTPHVHTLRDRGPGRSRSAGGHPGNGHRSGVRLSLPGDVENIRQTPPRNANPQVSGCGRPGRRRHRTALRRPDRSTAARLRLPRRSTSQRPRSRSASAGRAPPSATRTLLTYAPPSATARRAADRLAHSPLSASSSTTGGQPPSVGAARPSARGSSASAAASVAASRSPQLAAAEQRLAGRHDGVTLRPRRAPARSARSASARCASRAAGRSAAAFSSASISSRDRKENTLR